ncbi:LPS export ABC transporter periplasmic protein LptC [Candidatus Aerophobetes bacterium]|nr:LPS export ABC transporter periplasmic protein LptC [Candidatus Aerophobetes bacterium]
MKVQVVKFTQLEKEGEKSWEVFADEATQFTRKTILKNVRITLYQEGIPASEGEAKKVVIDEYSNLSLEGEIFIVSFADKAWLKTSELFWDNSEKKLYTEKEVTVKKGELIITGKGLIAKPDLSLIIIKSQVTTYIDEGSKGGE